MSEDATSFFSGLAVTDIASLTGIDLCFLFFVLCLALPVLRPYGTPGIDVWGYLLPILRPCRDNADRCLGLPYVTLFTIHYSPLTTHRSPLTTHRSPLTTHRSPITDYRYHQGVFCQNFRPCFWSRRSRVCQVMLSRRAAVVLFPPAR